jgi:hypothetical protein
MNKEKDVWRDFIITQNIAKQKDEKTSLLTFLSHWEKKILDHLPSNNFLHHKDAYHLISVHSNVFIWPLKVS